MLLDDVTLRAGAETAGHGWVSGHAAVAAALVTVLWPHLGRPARAVVIAVVLPMYVARIYTGSHLPLDMVGGACFGVVVGLVVRIVGGPMVGTVGGRVQDFRP